MKVKSLVLVLLTSVQVWGGQMEAKVIYGNDDRQDLYQVQDNRLQDLARSTVALMKASTVKISKTSKNARLVAPKFADAMGLCDDEPFKEQLSAGFCSGSLVGPDLVLTAGHCVRSLQACKDTKFVFDFAVSTQPARSGFLGRAANSKTVSEVPKNSVYGCAELLGRNEQGQGADWAVVKLDRPVTDRPFLHVRRQGSVAEKDGVTVIGYPSGIPVKVAGNANVRRVTANGYFVTDLDTYGGNSGSSVFNSQTLDIEGILVRGENDFVQRGSCTISNVCRQGDCRGEDVTLVSEALHLIPVAR
ncbi:MAG: serine protease [Bdellovibrionales bacterium]|nr:serine protease [Bdellovibrionales bacterium]